MLIIKKSITLIAFIFLSNIVYAQNFKHDTEVFKILKISEWKQFKKEKRFYGSEDDLIDGFIHLSTKDQLSRVLIKYFTNEIVYIVKFKTNSFGKNLKWENDYPHLYNRPLRTREIIGVDKSVPPHRAIFWVKALGSGVSQRNACKDANNKTVYKADSKCRDLGFTDYKVIKIKNCKTTYDGDDCDESDGGGYSCPDAFAKFSMKVKCI